MHVKCNACDFTHDVGEVEVVDVEEDFCGQVYTVTFVCPETDKVAQSNVYSGSGAV